VVRVEVLVETTQGGVAAELRDGNRVGGNLRGAGVDFILRRGAVKKMVL